MPKKIEIDKEMFERFCKVQCTKEEVCLVFGVDDNTLEKWCKKTYKAGFSEVFEQKRAGGKASLRRSQFQLADKNPTMSIWLGKQYLGQRDPDKEYQPATVITADDSFIQAMKGPITEDWEDDDADKS